MKQKNKYNCRGPLKNGLVVQIMWCISSLSLKTLLLAYVPILASESY